MTNKEAIETINANYPDERYTMLREALDLAIKALEKQDVPDISTGKWISVKDHYPTVTKEYQVALSTGGVIGAWWFNEEKDFMVGNTVITNNVAHWAPLYEPPKEET